MDHPKPNQNAVRIKAVLFDAGDILYRRPRRHEAWTRITDDAGVPPPKKGDAEMKRLRGLAHRGLVTRDDYFESLLNYWGVEGEARRAAALAQMDAAENDIDFTADVETTLKTLKSRGFLLGIITNSFEASATKEKWFRSVGIEGLWDSFATSSEVGLAKPAPGLYLSALVPLDIAPDEAAFVGHSQRELDGAKRVGMATIAFNRDDDSVTADHVVERFADLLNLTL